MLTQFGNCETEPSWKFPMLSLRHNAPSPAFFCSQRKLIYDGPTTPEQRSVNINSFNTFLSPGRSVINSATYPNTSGSLFTFIHCFQPIRHPHTLTSPQDFQTLDFQGCKISNKAIARIIHCPQLTALPDTTFPPTMRFCHGDFMWILNHRGSITYTFHFSF